MTIAHDSRTDAAPPALAEVMQRLGQRLSVAKDEGIFTQDDEADRVHLVVSGAVRTTRLLGDGRRQVAGFYYPGDLIGPETGALHRFSAEAVCDAAVLMVRRAALKAYAGEAGFERAFWEAARRELERTHDHLLVLGRKTACEKVASFLKSLALRQGADSASMPMSRQDVADYLGLTIETVSRMLTQLQGQSVVAFDGTRRFKVTRWDALEQMAA